VELQIAYLDQILIFAIFALSLNLLMGYAGQVSVAHAAFGAVGGYTLASLFYYAHLPTIAGLVAAVLLAALAGVIVGIPALRLTTEWLILLTLATQTIIIALVTTSSVLGGTHGMQALTGMEIFGHDLLRPSDLLPLFAICAAAVYAVCWRMGESPFGRVLRGIREDERACRSLGKNVFAYKLTVFAVSCGMAGLAGALLVVNTSIASPALFGFDQSTTIVAMVVLGGMGNLTGSVLGAAALVMLGPLFENVLKFSEDSAFLWRLIAYGVVLVVVVIVRPQGLVPEGFSIFRWLRARRTPATEAAAKPVLHLSANGHPSAPAPSGVADSDVVLSVSALSKSFGGILAAQGFDMELRRGKITALVGPNGAGKTTVFNLLTGAIVPDSGRILLRGEDITGMRPDAVAHRGMVRSFQDVRIFARMTALENVMLGIQQQPGESMLPLFLQVPRVQSVERRARERAREWLSFVGMDDFADLPAGALAFGQQKLVALARVLATDAEVLLLDEPSSGVDHQWVDAILGLVERVRDQGRTVCIVEHNLHVVERLADHTYFMELGRVTAQGNFRELTAVPRLAEAYFGTG
jgi:branched-chain amino acid transport system permease protein